jgi:RNA polymerase sigma-70 factor (ECF subfamily)
MAAEHPEMEVLAEVFERYRARLLPIIRRRIDGVLSARLDADDILSDAFLEAQRKWCRFEAHGARSPFAWLCRVVLDCIIERWRYHSRGVRNAELELPWPDQTSVHLALRLVDSGTSPSQAAIRLEIQERMKHALGLLKRGDREILELRYFDGLTFQETADVLNITVNAANLRCVRALERLTTIWKKLNPEQAGMP